MLRHLPLGIVPPHAHFPPSLAAPPVPPLPRSFVVHGGLNLGLDFMLYRGTPQRYHAEFGVLLRYPSSSLPGHRDGEGAGEGAPRLTWRDLHLLYRLIGVSAGAFLLVHFSSGSCLWSAVAAFFLVVS